MSGARRSLCRKTVSFLGRRGSAQLQGAQRARRAEGAEALTVEGNVAVGAGPGNKRACGLSLQSGTDPWGWVEQRAAPAMPYQAPQQELHSTGSWREWGGAPTCRPLGVLKALTRPVGSDLSHWAQLSVS